jgi:hypothetical protein
MGLTSRLALAGLALGVASANPMANGTIYTTEVVDTYVTYCPEPTELTLGGKTYTITKAQTVTITNCGCTVTKPVITTSAVVCKDCPKPTHPVPAPPKNGTTLVPGKPTAPGAVPPVATPTGGSGKPGVPASGAGKVAALSGAGLAGIVGLAAFIL